ncbi:zinc finger protein 624-like [Ochlerotatus camptorhynchus]|uniref:zinc finger protein 624-like n=1 Tax=Ochlerotatus camptorhynchus TaxID=644619 RepID=UPI0031CEB17D
MMDICRLASDDQPDSIKMVEIDFQALCRICGALGENLTSVFGKRAADRLRERIGKYLQIDILAEDCLPTKVCDGCRETLDRFHELYEKCHRTDEKFRTMMSSAEELKDAVAVVAEEEEADEEEEEEEEKETKLVTEEEVLEKEVEVEVEEEAPVCKKAKESKRDLKQEEAQGDSPEKHGKRFTRSSKAFTCNFCKSNGTIKANTFASKTALVDHLKDQHSEQIFHCEQCDNYLDRNILIQHMTMHALSMFSQTGPNESQPEDEDDHEQQTSGVDLEEGEGSQQTMEGKSGEGIELANKENDAKSPPDPLADPAEAATVPAAADTKPGDVRKLYCYICEKTLANRSAYSYHINQVHLNIKNFSCTYCSKKFGNQRLLNNHVAGVHSRDRNFTCETCSKRFKTNVALYNHQRIHDDAAVKFSCTFCDKKFRYRNHLTSHQLVHMNERNFPCNQCDKKFNNPECLQKHKLTHVETLPYQCPLCGFSTKQKRYLVMHAKRIHMVR